MEDHLFFVSPAKVGGVLTYLFELDVAVDGFEVDRAKHTVGGFRDLPVLFPLSDRLLRRTNQVGEAVLRQVQLLAQESEFGVGKMALARESDADSAAGAGSGASAT